MAKNEFRTQPIHPVMKESFIDEMRFQINFICLSGDTGSRWTAMPLDPGSIPA